MSKMALANSKEAAGLDNSLWADVKKIPGYDLKDLSEPQLSHLEAFRGHMKPFLFWHASFFLGIIVLVTIFLDIWFFKLMFEEYLINLTQEGSTSSFCFNCVTCKKYKLGR